MFVLLIIKVMKKFLITSILAAMVAIGNSVTAQERPDEYLGLPGDNFNLYAVMQLFQKSETLEGFERALNDENSRINNLDLNGDNMVDYIKVIDYVDGDVHTIVLQAVLGPNENQDVAVFTVQKFRDGSVQIQLTGDEALYGKNYIIEPIYDETPNPGYTGRATGQNVTVVRTTYVEVAAWPVVRFIFLPNYVVWHSAWYWGYYPHYWRTWNPWYWDYYYGYHYHWYPDYYRYYRHWDHHRYTHWNDFYYTGHRVYSRNVVMRVNEGRYRDTYSHPEQRREGEALYVKSHPDRPTRPEVVSTGTNNGRRSTAGSNGNVNNNRQSEGNRVSSGRRDNGNNRAIPRSTTTTNNRANSNSTAGQRTVDNNRRSNGNDNRKVSKPEQGQNNGNQGNGNNGSVSNQGQNNGNRGRSSGNSNNGSVSRPSGNQSSGEVRRSSGNGNNRSVSRPESVQRSGVSRQAPAQRAESPRTTKQSPSVSSSSRRSGGESKARNTEKKNSQSKDSGSSSRRK